MSLEMKVYRDPRRYEAKAMFGLTWRQLGALALGLPVAGGLYVLTVWLLMRYRGETFETATNASMVLLVILCIPFAVWGWCRPRGLKPERWIPYVFDYYLYPKELCRGYEKPVGRRPARGRGRDAHEKRTSVGPARWARARRRSKPRPSEHVVQTQRRLGRQRRNG